MTVEEKKKNNAGKVKKATKKNKLSVLDSNTAHNANLGSEQNVPSEKKNQSKSKSRQFETDLLEYLSTWENRETIHWKFNKVLQAWALSNVFDKEKISSTTFKQLCPYLKTVQGGARTRLLDEVNNVISKAESQVQGDEREGEGGEGEEGEGISEKTLKRAIKLKKLLDS